MKLNTEKKNVFLLGSTSFFNDISSELIFTLLPTYVTSPLLLGILGGIINGVGDFVKVFFGFMSDKLGKRKNIVILGYFTSSISKLSLAFVNIFLIPFALLFDRLGKGIREGPRDAILAVSKRRGWAFGIQKAMDTTGAALGSFLAYLFVKTALNIHIPLLIGAGVSFLALIPLLFLKDVKVKKTKTKFTKTLKTLPKNLKHFAIISGIFGLVLVSPLILVKSAFDFFGDVGLLIYVLFNISYAISASIFGSLSDKLGRSFVLKLSFTSTALSFFLMFFKGWYIILGLVLYGIAFGAFRSSANALVSDIGGKNKGSALGLFQTVLGLSILIGSVIFGYLIQVFSNNAYLVGAVFSLLSLFMYIKIIDPKTKVAY